MYNNDYDKQIRKLQDKISKLETELRQWHLNGIMIDLDDKLAIFARQLEEDEAELDERDRKENERIDDILQGIGF